MERKTFFEVFPDVKLNSELTEIFEQVEVTRITETEQNCVFI